MNYSNVRFLVAACVVVIAFSFSAVAQSTASIQGTVVDSATSRGIAGAIAIAFTVSAPANRHVATSSFDGSFQMTSVGAGTYDLCIQVPRDGYLSTCRWGIPSTTVTVAAGQRSPGNVVRLQAGSVLTVRVSDPGNLLNQKTKDGYDPDLIMGVWHAGMFYPAHPGIRDAAVAEYHLTVPRDRNLKFAIHSSRLVIGNGKGAPLTSNTDQQQFTHASSGANPASFSYSILSAIP